MTKIRGIITHSKEDNGLIWLSIHHKWIAIDKNIFHEHFENSLVEKYYKKHNKKIEKQIEKTKKEIKNHKKKGEELEAKSKEYHKLHLEKKKKKHMSVHELSGKHIIINIE